MNKWLSVICLTGSLIISNQASASSTDADVLFKEMGTAAQNLSYEMSFMTLSPLSSLFAIVMRFSMVFLFLK